MQYERSYSVKKTLSKDVHHKKLSGVCAGLAKYYQLPRLVVRMAAIVALITFPVATGVAYLVSALLMSDR
ncbi:PspC domain-containing protein [Thalassomonas actiniarum]|uniref:PspC domain-containing protein n=1 Tax=Thalassomonas actiniarum TaxID=485447 RepID=A0AAE9YNH5_9GAMM|nr:PspC domain-containing protein [Thalassomonas actiniarum]WDD98329.1 PspC domain-containing protein [Thalassomonas actiniarum]